MAPADTVLTQQSIQQALQKIVFVLSLVLDGQFMERVIRLHSPFLDSPWVRSSIHESQHLLQ